MRQPGERDLLLFFWKYYWNSYDYQLLVSARACWIGLKVFLSFFLLLFRYSFFLPSPLPQLSSRHSLSSRYLLAYLCQWIKKSTGSSLSSWMMEKKLKTCQMGEMSLNIHAWLTKDYAMLFYESLLSRICCRFDIFLLLSLYTPLSISCHLREKMSNKECCTRRIFSQSCSHIVCIRMFSVAIQFLQLGLPLSAPIDFNLSSRQPEPLQSIELTISLALLAFIYKIWVFLFHAVRAAVWQHCFGKSAREGNPMKIISINSNNPTIVNIKMMIKRQQATHDREERATMMMCDVCLLGHYFVV